MKYRRDNESVALQEYCNYTGNTVKPTGLWICRDAPQLACSPDGIVQEKTQTGYAQGLVEIKCPFVLKDGEVRKFKSHLTVAQQKAFCLEEGVKGFYLKTNHSYYTQVQMQMGVMGLGWCDFMVWCQKDFVVIRVAFDQDLWATMRQQLVEFHSTKLCPEYFEMKTVRKLCHTL